MGRDAFLIVIVGIALSCQGGCSPIPSKFIKQAEAGATLTALVNQPTAYAGKVVILGGAIVEERQADGRAWLHVRNRPLDVDYEPHRDPRLRDSEDGFYWIVLDPKSLPPSYKEWARLTVVGTVMPPDAAGVPRDSGAQRPEPVLGALYLRGWGYGLKDPTWEAFQDPNYIVSTPLRTKPGQ
jgi:starvation-inducible outer membrane lipoprotein